jgi:cardiolipin synthase
VGHPLSPLPLLAAPFWTLIRRNHRKTLVCDGEVAFTGGINISDKWSPESEGGGGWHDAAVEIRGPAVATIEAVLLRTWNWRSKRRLRLKAARLVRSLPAGHVPLAVIANREVVDRFAIRRAALHAIRASLSRVYLASPYFVPDPGFVRSLAHAARRGIDVRILVPKHSDTQSVDLASRATFSRLLPAGVRIFQHHPVIHTKALLVDDGFVSLGSYNIDHRSLVYNLELVVNALDRELQRRGRRHAGGGHGRRAGNPLGNLPQAFALTRMLERLAYSFRHWFLNFKYYLNSAMTGA